MAWVSRLLCAVAAVLILAGCDADASDNGATSRPYQVGESGPSNKSGASGPSGKAGCADWVKDDGWEYCEQTEFEAEQIDQQNDYDHLIRQEQEAQERNTRYQPGYGDLDCSDLYSRAEAQSVLDQNRSDPHYLDADFDGIACESATQRLRSVAVGVFGGTLSCPFRDHWM